MKSNWQGSMSLEQLELLKTTFAEYQQMLDGNMKWCWPYWIDSLERKIKNYQGLKKND